MYRIKNRDREASLAEPMVAAWIAWINDLGKETADYSRMDYEAGGPASTNG